MRTEAALFGTQAQVAAKRSDLEAAGVGYVLCNILDQHRPTLRTVIAT